MTKRFWRHTVPKVKLALLAPSPFAIGYLSGSCLLEAWRQAVGKDALLPGTVALIAGCMLALLALLCAAEINVAYRRWIKAQEAEDRRRCPLCDGLLKPAVRDAERLICLACARAGWASAGDLPVAARKAGL